MKALATNNYDVVWEVNGVVKEVIAWNIPIGIAKSIKKQKENSTHRLGKVCLRVNK